MTFKMKLKLFKKKYDVVITDRHVTTWNMQVAGGLKSFIILEGR